MTDAFVPATIKFNDRGDFSRNSPFSRDNKLYNQGKRNDLICHRDILQFCALLTYHAFSLDTLTHSVLLFDMVLEIQDLSW